MKLSTYTRQIGVTYKTAYRWCKAGKPDAYQLDTGTVMVRGLLKVSAKHVALYARVSRVDQKNDLERQLERLKNYAAANGYQVTRMNSEIGSELNDRRSKVHATPEQYHQHGCANVRQSKRSNPWSRLCAQEVCWWS
jgi:putative resolvase